MDTTVSQNVGADSVLNDVTCSSSSQCWAVGSSYDGATAAHTVIEQWNGIAWAIVASPNSSLTQNNEFEKVACTSATNCWAVGSHYNDSNLNETLSSHWDGSSWTLVATPNADPSQNNILSGITCASASDCWAVGDLEDIYQTESHSLIEH